MRSDTHKLRGQCKECYHKTIVTYYQRPEIRLKCRQKARTFYRQNAEKCRQWRREYGIKNKQVELAKDRIRNKLRRIQVLAIVGRGKVQCMKCGCANPCFLEINHINGGGAYEFKKVCKSAKYFYTDIIKGKRGIDDLNLLCKVCNNLDHLTRKYGETGYTITWALPAIG